jgi:hypothetical protein
LLAHCRVIFRRQRRLLDQQTHHMRNVHKIERG